MTKKFLLFLFAAISIKAVAQPTLTAGWNTPHAGDIHRYLNCDTVLPGPGGANQTWDFSGMDTITGYIGGFAACPAAIFCDTFVGSTLSGTSQGTFRYYKTPTTAFQLNGFRITANYKYTDPEDILRYPMSYGTNNIFSDTFNANAQAGGHNYVRMGRVYDTADGWGTLQLPNGTFTNVLRVKRVQMYQDSDMTDQVSTHFVQESYTWYSTGNREYLLQIMMRTVINGFPTGVPSAVYTDQTPNSVANINTTEAGIMLSPNPAKEYLNITFADALNEEMSICLTDVLGKVMIQSTCAKGTQQYKMNTSGIPSGIYLLRFKTSQGTAVSKVEIL